MNLLQNILVLDFSQFLSGPSAGLRLADLGARVIKIERPGIGDICRELYVSDIVIDGDSTIFHAINRNKESYAADLKVEDDLVKITKLIKYADVMIHNFRPGVMERIGLDFEKVKSINPGIIYAEITGYGNTGEWKNNPGQDLLVQAVSGLSHLSGKENSSPVPMGVAVADILTGTHLVQGILATLLQKQSTNEGAFIQVNMLESLLDFQSGAISCFYNNGRKIPQRSEHDNGNLFLSLPYGIFPTADGHIALAVHDANQAWILLNENASLHDIPTSSPELKQAIAKQLQKHSSEEWLRRLEPASKLENPPLSCSTVLNYDELVAHEGYKDLEMEQIVDSAGKQIKTTRNPIRINGNIVKNSKGAPLVGEDNLIIDQQFNL